MEKEARGSLRSFVLEMFVYAALVTGYFFLVLHFLGGWLFRLFEQQRTGYALTALALIIAQGFILEVLTRLLLTFFQRRTQE